MRFLKIVGVDRDGYPNAAHDDIVDAISLALSTLHATPPPRTWMRWRAAA